MGPVHCRLVSWLAALLWLGLEELLLTPTTLKVAALSYLGEWSPTGLGGLCLSWALGCHRTHR